MSCFCESFAIWNGYLRQIKGPPGKNTSRSAPTPCTVPQKGIQWRPATTYSHSFPELDVPKVQHSCENAENAIFFGFLLKHPHNHFNRFSIYSITIIAMTLLRIQITVMIVMGMVNKLIWLVTGDHTLTEMPRTSIAASTRWKDCASFLVGITKQKPWKAHHTSAVLQTSILWNVGTWRLTNVRLTSK